MTFLWLRPRHPDLSGALTPAIFFTLALLQFLCRYFVYWDVGADGLHERIFVRHAHIAWDKIRHVRPYVPGLKWGGVVSVYFSRTESRFGFGYIVTMPEHRKKFVAALQRYAPQATFDV